jgi:ATP-dependent DNA helicase RecQ
MEDRTIDAQKFLSCVARTDQRFGMRHIIDILRGANTQKIRNFHHDGLSTYGIGKDLSVSEWQRLGRGLLQQGMLSESQEGYAIILKLNAGSIEILKRQRTFELAILPKEPVTQHNERDTAKSLVDLSMDELGLFQHLRTLRKRLADELAVPPYVVFPDSSLQAMAQRRPQDEAHFIAIPGVGQRKLEAYGAAFTDALREYCLLHNMEMNLEPLDEEEQPETRTNTRRNAGSGPSQHITLNMYKEGKSIAKIAQERNLKPSTVVSHLAELIEDGETIDITPLILPGHFDTIVAALYKAGFAGRGQAPALRPVKELLGDEYSYDEIRLVRAYLQNRGGN